MDDGDGKASFILDASRLPLPHSWVDAIGGVTGQRVP